jgi:ribosomal-protein-alanine N-acetyltransferase
MHVTVEKAKLANLKALWRIERECFSGEAFTEEQIETLIRDPNAISLLVRVNGEVAGFIIGMIESQGMTRVGHIYTIDVAVKHRRKGIGARLLSEIESIFSNSGAKTSHLEVRADNETARQLYKKQEYTETEILENYYPHGIHGLRLVKRLK